MTQVGDIVILREPGREEQVVHLKAGQKTVEHIVYEPVEVAAIVTRVWPGGELVDVIRFDPATRPAPHGGVHVMEGATEAEATVRPPGTPFVPSTPASAG